ncbi:hypothetical protein OsI_32153 [Oryza sativa Indica Group]|uniref:AB hydrolase-1 domain-containing protein n=1 Tax=Oryza sativa subsp. indica TaxID=39946 RepID=B8BDU6_ORYSI|nr:hypothetical protein OsI_32153 [Oryza sativa Indica Group]
MLPSPPAPPPISPARLHKLVTSQSDPLLALELVTVTAPTTAPHPSTLHALALRLSRRREHLPHALALLRRLPSPPSPRILLPLLLSALRLRRQPHLFLSTFNSLFVSGPSPLPAPPRASPPPPLRSILHRFLLPVRRYCLTSTKKCAVKTEVVVFSAAESKCYSDTMLKLLLFALEDLKMVLKSQESDLLIGLGNAEDVVLKLVNEVQAGLIFTEEEVEYRVRNVLASVESSLSNASFLSGNPPEIVVWSASLYDYKNPRELSTSHNQFLKEKLPMNTPLAAPSLPALNIEIETGSLPTLEELKGFLKEHRTSEDNWVPLTSTSARSILKKTLSQIKVKTGTLPPPPPPPGTRPPPAAAAWNPTTAAACALCLEPTRVASSGTLCLPFRTNPPNASAASAAVVPRPHPRLSSCRDGDLAILLSALRSPPASLPRALSSAFPSPSGSFLIGKLPSLLPLLPSPLRFLLWRLPPSSPLPSSYALSSLAASLPDLPSSVPLLLSSSPQPLPLRHYALLLTISAHAGLFPASLALLRHMRSFGLAPDAACFRSALRSAASPGDVCAVLGIMSACGVSPSVPLVVASVHKLATAGDFVGARQLIEKMPEFGCVTNVQFRGCGCSVGAGGRDGGWELGCRRMGEALSLLDRMTGRGVMPNRVFVRTLVSGFCSEEMVADAYAVVERVVSDGSVSSEQCYNVLLVCLWRVGMDGEAEGLGQRMMKKGVRLSPLAASVMVRELCNRNRLLDACYWIGVMEENGVLCDTDVYNGLLLRLCVEGHVGEALALAKKECRVWTITLLGFGKSEKPNINYSELLWSELLRDFIVDVVKEPVHLVGNSIGGYICAITAGLWPSLARSLILLNTAGSVVPSYSFIPLSEEGRTSWFSSLQARLLLLFLRSRAGGILKEYYPTRTERVDKPLVDEIIRAVSSDHKVFSDSVLCEWIKRDWRLASKEDEMQFALRVNFLVVLKAVFVYGPSSKSTLNPTLQELFKSNHTSF